LEGLVDDMGKTNLDDKRALAEGMKAGGNGNDEWEVLQHDADVPGQEEEVAIRVDQYLVVFLKVSKLSLTGEIFTDINSSWQVLHLVLSMTSLWVYKGTDLILELGLYVPGRFFWRGRCSGNHYIP